MILEKVTKQSFSMVRISTEKQKEETQNSSILIDFNFMLFNFLRKSSWDINRSYYRDDCCVSYCLRNYW